MLDLIRFAVTAPALTVLAYLDAWDRATRPLDVALVLHDPADGSVLVLHRRVAR